MNIKSFLYFFIALILIQNISFAEGIGVYIGGGYSFPVGNLSDKLNGSSLFEAGLEYDDLIFEGFNLELNADFISYPYKIGSGNFKEYNLKLLGRYDIDLSRGIDCIYLRAGGGVSLNKKVAYYVEGSPYEQGYLMGLMSEPEVENMCVNFNRDIVFDFRYANPNTKVTKKH